MAVARAQRGEGLHQSHSTGRGDMADSRHSRNRTNVKLSQRDGDTGRKNPSGTPRDHVSPVAGPTGQGPEKEDCPHPHALTLM